MTSQDVVSILISFFAAAVIAFAATPLVSFYAKRIGAIDVPKDGRRMHKKPIPRLGGLAIFFVFTFSALLFCNIFESKQLKTILIASVLILLVGIFDDIRPLRPGIKLAVQILAAAFVILYGGVRLEMLTNFLPFAKTPFISFGVFAVPITLIWIVGITNAVNLIDGLDGLAAGVSSIACFSLLIISILLNDLRISLVAAALAGACIGFIPYNLNPARIFMGDTGATFLGFILACFSITGLFKFYTVVSFAVPFMILGLPIFDTLFAILRRIIKGQSPMQADRGHLHHRLIDAGFSQKQSVAILYSISAVFGVAAVLFAQKGYIKALILIFTVILISVLYVKIFTNGNNNEGTVTEQAKEDNNEEN